MWVDPGAQGPWPWRATEYGTEYPGTVDGEPEARPDHTPRDRPMVCPACLTENRPSATVCTICDWPFPVPRPMAPREHVAVDWSRRPSHATIRSKVDDELRAYRVQREIRASREVASSFLLVLLVGILLTSLRPPSGVPGIVLVVLLCLAVALLVRTIHRVNERR